jgi:periplasmic copper chaperone A
MPSRKILTAAALGVVGILTLAGPAGAHVTPSETEAAAGSYVKFDLRVGHGCDDGDTTKVEVQVPEGIYTATPQVVPGWTVSKTTEALDQPVDDGHGGRYTERDATVIWEGGPLAHDQLEEFGLSVKVPDTPGETIWFPTIQTCDNGQSNDWIQIPVAGEEEPESPAPGIALTAATGDGHGNDAEAEAVGVPVASGDDDDDDGVDGLAVAGLLAGLGGLALGGAALLRTRRPT